MAYLESYLRFKIQTTGPKNRVFNEGGVANVFNRVVLRTKSGSVIEDLDYYFMEHNIIQNVMHSPQFVKTNGWLEADSLSDTSRSLLNGNDLIDLLNGNDGVTFTHADREFALAGTASAKAFEVQPKINDTVKVSASSGTFTAKITSIESNTDEDFKFRIAALGTNNNVPESDIAAGAVHELFLVNQDEETSQLPARAEIARSSQFTTVCMKIKLNSLMRENYIPLFLVRGGFELELHLNRPEHVMYSVSTPANVENTEFGYTVRDPVFVSSLYTLTPDVMEKYYIEPYRKDGLKLHYNSYHHNSSNIRGNADTSSHLYPYRSATHIYSVITAPNISSLVSAVSKTNDTNTFIKSGLNEFYYQNGSEKYPDFAPVNVDSKAIETYQQLMITSGNHFSTVSYPRFPYKYWLQENDLKLLDGSTDATEKDAKKFIISTRFNRDGTPLSGINVTLNNLDLNLRFDNDVDSKLGNYRVVHNFLYYDAVLHISQDGVFVRK